MEQKEFIKKLMIWTAIVLAIIIAIIGLTRGHIIEGSLFAEVAKWVVMGLGVIGIVEGFIFMGVGGLLYHFWYKQTFTTKLRNEIKKGGGLLHAETSALIVLAFTTFLPVWLSVGLAFIAGIGKEVYDHYNGGVVSWEDIICDLAGITFGGCILLLY